MLVMRGSAVIARTWVIEMFWWPISQGPGLPDAVLEMKWKRAEIIKSFDIAQFSHERSSMHANH